LIAENPFEHLDFDGVGRLIKMTVEEGRVGRAKTHNGET
jgi:hypothetical protein